MGRRLALSGCMLLAGVVLVLSPLIPPDQVVNEDADDHDDHDDDEDHDDHDAWKIALCDWMLVDGVYHKSLKSILFILPFARNNANYPQSSWLVALSMLGKLAITSAYGTVYIFSTELFPTRYP